MPRTYKRSCNFCHEPYEGRGIKFCGPACSAAASRKAPETATQGSSTVTFSSNDRVSSLSDLERLFDVDKSRYDVRDFHVNSREKHTVADGFVTMHTVRANLVPKHNEGAESALSEMARDFYADAQNHAPRYEPVERPAYFSDPLDKVLFELAVFDAHIGMLAWEAETGEDYDSIIGASDYTAAVDGLLPIARIYPTTRILYVVGNDFLHVDTVGQNLKGGTTAAGTNQDIDTRMAKMFTTGRKIAVNTIDKARLIAPVDVLVVPGNHDPQQMYRMGEVLAAWYRNDPEVNVIFGPNKRKFYGFGNNAFMFTHGEEYNRKSDSLPLIFATECPPDLWVNATCKEVHTGHNHRTLAGRYYPTSEATEERAIRVRSLPGMTATDAWHHEQGYRHTRAATALAYKKGGGFLGLHEYNYV